ncbi:MAG: hypothetical protein ACRDZ8_11425 [Acidimicrobiales bacterium]
MRTEYEFILPRGYLDEEGVVHRKGTMRLATARDELEPLRDPTINSADDPRLTIVVLARVVETLGTLRLVTAHEIEGLFAADLAYLQDFYGVINFGTDEDINALMEAQEAMLKPAVSAPRLSAPAPAPAVSAPAPPVSAPAPSASSPSASDPATSSPDGDVDEAPPERPAGRRGSIEEVPASGR